MARSDSAGPRCARSGRVPRTKVPARVLPLSFAEQAVEDSRDDIGQRFM